MTILYKLWRWFYQHGKAGAMVCMVPSIHTIPTATRNQTLKWSYQFADDIMLADCKTNTLYMNHSICRSGYKFDRVDYEMKQFLVIWDLWISEQTDIGESNPVPKSRIAILTVMKNNQLQLHCGDEGYNWPDTLPAHGLHRSPNGLIQSSIWAASMCTFNWSVPGRSVAWSQLR